MKLHSPLFMVLSIAVLSIAVLSIAVFAPAAPVQTPDPDVQKLLGQVATAYHNLTALSTTLVSTQSIGTADRKVTTNLKLKKPNLLYAEFTSGKIVNHLVADGTTLYTDSSHEPTKYMQQPYTKLDAAVIALNQRLGAGIGLLSILLTSPISEKEMIPGKPSSVKHTADQTFDNVACDVVVANIGTGENARRLEYDFGKQDHLLRRLAIGSAKEGEKPTIVETYSDVNVNPTFTDATFKYTPPAGTVATDPPKPAAKYDPRIKVGAEPFPITGKDLSGKTVSLDHYKGKVLLLDFWATWDGPSTSELPNVIDAYDKYHAKGFEVLGISLDRANAKETIEKFIKEQRMPWKQVYDGKDWKAVNAVAYGVKDIPFSVLIGHDGKIVAVGNQIRGDKLAPAIEAALSQ